MSSLLEDLTSGGRGGGVSSLRLPVLRFRRRGGGDEVSVREVSIREEEEEEEGNLKRVRVELLEWHELPEWQQRGGSHIVTGYRKACGSVKGCLYSWAYLHNESVNIYSHLLGAAIFLALPSYIFATSLPPRYAIASTTDVVVCSAWFLGVGICFLFSVAFHTLMSHSEKWYLTGITLDYQGVLVLMWSATLPLIHYTLLCHQTSIRVAYLFITTVLALACGIATAHPNMGAVHLGYRRAVLFACFGTGSFVVPILHGVWAHGWDVQGRLGLGYVLGTAGCDAVGMGAYVAKIPERWCPRRFDLFGASHQLMHIFVLVAAFMYSGAVLMAFDYRHSSEGMCPSS